MADCYDVTHSSLPDADNALIMPGQPAASETSAITATLVASGLSGPLFAASPPGDPDRLFVVEQHTGRILILDADSGVLSPTPFLDIPDNELGQEGEQGLLGLAFHPDYVANGKFYVSLTNAAGAVEIREYTRAGSDMVDLGSSRLILSIDHPTYANHNGGWLGFGPDGMLYVATGDGGGGGDPLGNAQNPDSLLGKILRIDVNNDGFPGDPARNYAVPADNPFVNGAPADEIYALGLRNPWRLSFDVNGDLYIADVGQGMREEVNVIRAGSGGGQNFGWNYREGTFVYTSGEPGGLVAPILEYDHGSGALNGRSITGGYVYHGPGSAQGLYIFGDFVTGNLFTMRTDGSGFANANGLITIEGGGDIDLIASFAVDGRGRLYLIGLDGEIHRLTPSLTGTAGDDEIRGTHRADSLDGGAGADILHGMEGDDIIYGGDGADTIDGGDGNDQIWGYTGNDTLYGGNGQDFIDGQDGDDAIFGGPGGGVLFGGRGADMIVGAELTDLIFGQEDNDRLWGAAGADRMSGGGGADFLDGQDGDDILTGDLGDDLIYGGGGDDSLAGNAGLDILFGEAGVDSLHGGDGQDFLFGGAGADVFAFDALSQSTGAAPDQVLDFNAAEGDTIDVRLIDADVGAAGDQDFVFVSSFGGRAGEAVLNYDAAANRTALWLDNTGDGAADFVLWISGQVSGNAGWVGVGASAIAPSSESKVGTSSPLILPAEYTADPDMAGSNPANPLLSSVINAQDADWLI